MQRLKWLAFLALSAFSLSAGAEAEQGKAPEQDDNMLIVASRPLPAGDILQFIKLQLAQQGVTLRLQSFNDVLQPNLVVSTGDVDVSCDGDINMLKLFNGQRQTHLVSLGEIYIAPMRIYSDKIHDLKDLRRNAIVAIPSDAVSAARALHLLEQADLIRLKSNAGLKATVKDIVSNRLQLIFREMQSATIAREVQNADLAVFNNNYVVEAYDELKNKVLGEESHPERFATVCATTQGNLDNPNVQALMKAWRSDETRRYLDEHYRGILIPIDSVSRQGQGAANPEPAAFGSSSFGNQPAQAAQPASGSPASSPQADETKAP